MSEILTVATKVQPAKYFRSLSLLSSSDKEPSLNLFLNNLCLWHVLVKSLLQTTSKTMLYVCQWHMWKIILCLFTDHLSLKKKCSLVIFDDRFNCILIIKDLSWWNFNLEGNWLSPGLVLEKLKVFRNTYTYSDHSGSYTGRL